MIQITKEELVRHRYGKIVVLPTSFFEAPPTDAEQLWEEGISMLSLISGPIKDLLIGNAAQYCYFTTQSLLSAL